MRYSSRRCAICERHGGTGRLGADGPDGIAEQAQTTAPRVWLLPRFRCAGRSQSAHCQSGHSSQRGIRRLTHHVTGYAPRMTAPQDFTCTPPPRSPCARARTGGGGRSRVWTAGRAPRNGRRHGIREEPVVICALQPCHNAFQRRHMRRRLRGRRSRWSSVRPRCMRYRWCSACKAPGRSIGLARKRSMSAVDRNFRSARLVPERALKSGLLCAASKQTGMR